LGEAPCTGVKRFFLTPNNGLGIGVHIEVLLQQLPWEWVQLLDTSNGGVFQIVVCAMLIQRGIDLTSAKNDTINLSGFVDGLSVFRVRNDPFELRILTGKIFD
jgi:hypothetical protein